MSIFAKNSTNNNGGCEVVEERHHCLLLFFGIRIVFQSTSLITFSLPDFKYGIKHEIK